MAIVSVDLPVPLSDGVGAAQAVTGLGLAKTIVVGGTFDNNATILIEASGAAVGGEWVQIAAIRQPGIIPLTVVANRMRVRVAGILANTNFAPNVDIAAESGTPAYAQAIAPAGTGTGASVNVTAVPDYRTIFITGTFTGVVEIQASNDNNDFAAVKSFTAPAQLTQILPVAFLRIVRRGVDPADPGLPIVFIGGVAAAAGGASNTIDVEDEGVFVGTEPILNFIGAGVTAVDDPGNTRVNITIPGGAESAVICFGSGNINAAANTRFIEPWFGGIVGAADPVGIEIPCPRSGTLRSLFVRHNRATGNGNSVVYTVLVNGIPTALTVTLATGAVGQASDLVNSVAVAQGDQISLSAVKALAVGNGAVIVTASMELV